jgi:hypothetical protein
MRKKAKGNSPEKKKNRNVNSREAIRLSLQLNNSGENLPVTQAGLAHSHRALLLFSTGQPHHGDSHLHTTGTQISPSGIVIMQSNIIAPIMI